MGLDQYGFARKSGHQDIEIMYWRKHANLEGWMAGLTRAWWKERFNCVELKLTEGNLNALAMNVENLKKSEGFFWGESTEGDTLIQNSLSKRQGIY